MQVFRKGGQLLEIGDELDVELHCEHLLVTLPAKIIRRECVGIRRHVYGAEFGRIDEALRTKLKQLIDAACEPYANPSCWIAA